jgi:pimeloyl-ACP methyl ester carboxylesterase
VTPDGTFREGWVETDGFRVRYLDGGSGDPLVVLHGAEGPRITLAQRRLAAGRRLIVPELPGFGTSARNDQTASGREMAATVAAAAGALGLDTFDLLGSSMGGVVACWLAADAPQQVRALVLEGPAAFRPSGRPRDDDSPAARVRRLNLHPERLAEPPAPLDRAYWERTWPLIRRLTGPPHDEELAAVLPAVMAPCLILWGTRDGVFSPAGGATYQRLLPNAFLSYVYDAAHDVQGDQPETFAAVVSDFLARHGAFLVTDGHPLITT